MTQGLLSKYKRGVMLSLSKHGGAASTRILRRAQDDRPSGKQG